MGRYILIRTLEAAVAIWGVLLIVFFAARLGGDPAVLLLPMGASDQDLELLRRNLGLDRPMFEQYLIFMANALRGDFGFSFEFHRPAMEVVLERLPATVQLGAFGIVFGTIIGLAAGFIAALKRGGLTEFLVMLVALVGQAMPVFWLGLLLMMVFAVQLQWLPSGGTGSFANIILPGLTLAVYISASLARLLRSSMVEILHEDYIRTARAKGLDPSRIHIVHAVRSALIPVVTMLGIIIGETLSGAVIIETIFSWPGVGRVTVQAIQTRDFAVVMAAVAVFSVIFVVINLIVDLLYAVLDPRVRLVK